MTLQEIYRDLERLHERLIELSTVRISYSNYNEVMRKYQALLRDHIVITKELTGAVVSALTPHSVATKS
jgi:DNA-binding transcriptional regulator YhcF (GntR family)